MKFRSIYCWIVVLCCFGFFCTHISSQTQLAALAGRVRDESGAAVSNAQLEFREASRLMHTTTGTDGRFSFPGPVTNGTLTVKASGFSSVSLNISAQTTESEINVELKPASIREQVTVTATRSETQLSSTAASVRVLTPDVLATTAALTIDDALRQVPGFQLFRRSGSRTANPTSQGVSLRGVGASGASRALVLSDGIPFADPFGAWVYWDRLPRAAVNTVEVVRGGASELYGANALGGVINILSRFTTLPTIAIETSYGNQDTPNLSLFSGTGLGKFTGNIAGEAFKTDGYTNVPAGERGFIDTPVASRHRSLYFEVGYKPNEKTRLFLRPSYFAESRGNGTPAQTNRTHIRELDGGADLNLVNSSMSVRGYLSTQTYDQTFSAIAADRNSETLTRLQRVPAQAAGASFQWVRSFGERYELTAGAEVREVRGASDEIAFVGGKPSALIGAGGRQRSYAGFFRDSIKLNSKFSVTGGVRADLFKNVDAFTVSHSLLAGSIDQIIRFPNRSESSISPQLSVLYKTNEKLSLFGSFYRAFRMPTLNELYRSFRLGNVSTLANEKLRREQATGGEGGFRFSPWQDRLDLRTSFFFNVIDQPIANVTLSTSPALIVRQRQNLGSTRSMGMEVDSFLHVTRNVNLSASYLFADARVISFPVNTALKSLMIPQTPRHNFTFQINYAGARKYRFGLQGRASSSQFEDDQNLFRLRSYFLLDVYVSRFISRKVELFAAGENVFNSRYEIGRTPVTTVGSPALVRVGVKINYRKENR